VLVWLRECATKIADTPGQKAAVFLGARDGAARDASPDGAFTTCEELSDGIDSNAGDVGLIVEASHAIGALMR
jgi:hypothetical protein